MTEETAPISRKGTIGEVGIPVSLLLSWPSVIVERSDDAGQTWQRVHSEFERNESKTLVRARPKHLVSAFRTIGSIPS